MHTWFIVDWRIQAGGKSEGREDAKKDEDKEEETKKRDNVRFGKKNHKTHCYTL